MAGAVYVSCSGRGGPHFGARHGELQVVGIALGDVPLVGFFAAGEIARHHLYGAALPKLRQLTREEAARRLGVTLAEIDEANTFALVPFADPDPEFPPRSPTEAEREAARERMPKRSRRATAESRVGRATERRVMTPAELAALPELPAPTFTQREEIIDGERVMLPALPPILFPGARLTTQRACMTSTDSLGRSSAWATRRLRVEKCVGWHGRSACSSAAMLVRARAIASVLSRPEPIGFGKSIETAIRQAAFE